VFVKCDVTCETAIFTNDFLIESSLIMLYLIL